jgi:alpha-ketoglutarate-dependent taurine dioxygenase
MFTTVELTPRIGSEIRTDRKTLLEGVAAAEIRRLLEERGVLVFRELGLTEEEQIAFSKTLGGLDQPGGRKVMKISLDREEQKDSPGLVEYLQGSFYWHIDGATDDVPALATLLTGRRLSETGGQTEFANTYAAYEALPEAEKEALAKVQVVHAFEAAQRYVKPEPSYDELMGWRRRPPKTHPLIWTHRSGRKSLVLGATASHVEGMSREEGAALLCRLRDWATQPQFVYQHRWAIGDLLIWDNTGTMHRVTPYPLDSGRLMTRTSLLGEEAVA